MVSAGRRTAETINAAATPRIKRMPTIKTQACGFVIASLYFLKG
jgi:hypothetical protein